MKHNFKQGDNCRTLRVVRQHAKKLSAKDTGVLQTLFADAVAVYNSALYELRQNHFKNYGTPEKPIPYEGKKICLTYGTVYNTVKTKPCYKQFNANMGQQMIMKAVGDFESYLALLAKSEAGFYNKEKVRMPRYKKHGNILVIEEITRYSKGGIFTIPRSREFKKTEKHAVRITMPPVVSDKKVKRVTLINKISHIEIFWTYECDIVKPVEIKNKYAAIDIGVNNLMTVTISDGGSFIVDGKRLKSINQFYHKQIAEIQSKHAVNGIDKWTGVQYKLLSKRESRVRDYLFKAAKILMDRLIQNKVGTLIVGVNKYRKQNIDIGKKNNQTFVSIPFWKLRRILRYKCEEVGIEYFEQEESYTSKASFFDRDNIPVYGKTDNDARFGGKREKGLYTTKSGRLLNADVNAALNIFSKWAYTSCNADAVSVTEQLRDRGAVNTPRRIAVYGYPTEALSVIA